MFRESWFQLGITTYDTHRTQRVIINHCDGLAEKEVHMRFSVRGTVGNSEDWENAPFPKDHLLPRWECLMLTDAPIFSRENLKFYVNPLFEGLHLG